MTTDEIKEMNVKQVAERFLSNKCGDCCVCEFSKNIAIGGLYTAYCHVICEILREDRKQYVKIQPSTAYEILGRVK